MNTHISEGLDIVTVDLRGVYINVIWVRDTRNGEDYSYYIPCERVRAERIIDYINGPENDWKGVMVSEFDTLEEALNDYYKN